MLSKALLGLIVVICLAFTAGVASADPSLQLYLKGGSWDSVTETWVANGGSSFQLWVIADRGSVLDVKLSAVYLSTESPIFTITPTTTGGFGGFADPSTPGAPTLVATGVDTVPTRGDGSALPSHGEYGPGKTWSEFLLGDMDGVDSPGADFQSILPSPSAALEGQINAYDISVTGASVVHFDTFDHVVVGGNRVKYVFGPFSHDGEAGVFMGF